MLEASIGPAPRGARRKRRRIPASRNITNWTLSPQKLPITVRVSTAPRMYPIHPMEPLLKTSTKKNRKPSGMIRLKKRKVRLRMARRTRIFVSVQVLVTGLEAIFCLVPQPAAGQLDEHVFERGREHFQALQFVVFGFELLYERDDGARRKRGMQDIGAVEVAAIGDAFERAENTVGERAGEADFDARGPGGGMFQFARRAGFDDAAVIDDRDAIAEALGFFDVMGGDKHGFFVFAQFFDNVVDLAADLRVEACGGLVEKDDLRVIHQRHGQGETLFLAAGKLAVEGVVLFFQLKALQQRFGVGAVAVEIRE